MALITCPECGNKVSSRAKLCPQCGYPIEEDFKYCEYQNAIEQKNLEKIECILGYLASLYRNTDGIEKKGLKNNPIRKVYAEGVFQYENDDIYMYYNNKAIKLVEGDFFRLISKVYFFPSSNSVEIYYLINGEIRRYYKNLDNGESFDGNGPYRRWKNVENFTILNSRIEAITSDGKAVSCTLDGTVKVPSSGCWRIEKEFSSFLGLQLEAFAEGIVALGMDNTLLVEVEKARPQFRENKDYWLPIQKSKKIRIIDKNLIVLTTDNKLIMAVPKQETRDEEECCTVLPKEEIWTFEIGVTDHLIDEQGHLCFYSEEDDEVHYFNESGEMVADDDETFVVSNIVAVDRKGKTYIVERAIDDYTNCRIVQLLPKDVDELLCKYGWYGDANNKQGQLISIKEQSELKETVYIEETLGEEKKSKIIYDKKEFIVKDATLLKYRGLSDVAVVPNGIKTIARNAFQASSIKNILLPDSLKTIEEHAFEGCKNLASIEIPDSVSEIGGHSFGNCYELKTVRLPKSLHGIHGCLFANCINLESVKIPESVTEIDQCAFANCYSLRSIDIPESVSYIREAAFEDCCLLEEVKLPDSSHLYLQKNAFKGCGIKKLIGLPSNQLDELEEFGMINLSSVVIPNSVTEIGHGLFRNLKSLKTVILPDSLIKIGPLAFSGCSSLETISLPESIEEIGRWAFSECTKLASISIPPYVTAIKSGTFADCSQLSSIDIPDLFINEIEEDAFKNCKNLKTINASSSIKEKILDSI